MAKSHAQRQKEYRERKKAASGKHWMKEKSSRTKKYYKKVSTLTKIEAKKRRKYLREKQASYRAKRKCLSNNDRLDNPIPSTSSDIPASELTCPNAKMIVKLPHQIRRKCAKSTKRK